jgi:cell division protein FtsB
VGRADVGGYRARQIDEAAEADPAAAPEPGPIVPGGRALPRYGKWRTAAAGPSTTGAPVPTGAAVTPAAGAGDDDRTGAPVRSLRRRAGRPPAGPADDDTLVEASPAGDNDRKRRAGETGAGDAGTSAAAGGDDSDGDRDGEPAVRRALQVVRDAGHAGRDRLAAPDEETREARHAMLRRAGTRVGSVAVAGVMIYAVFPVRTYLDQRAATRRAEEQIEVLGQENGRLEEQVERLNTDDEVERIAREQYGLVKPGEEAYGLLPAPTTDDGPSDTAGTSGTGPEAGGTTATTAP